MKYRTASIGKLKQDPDQPRKYVDEEALKEMAVSVKNEGLINPIEVDENFVIVTGEMRWRASKLAGLKEVPVRIIEKITPAERFLRQVQENLHQNAMSDWDTANALQKLLSLPRRGRHPKTPLTGPGSDKGITWLSGRTGKSRGYIEEKLSYLTTSKPIQKALKAGKITGTYVRAINRAPEKQKKAVEDKILGKQFATADGAVSFASALVREEANPHNVKELLDTDYSKYKNDHEVKGAIEKISPPDHELIAKSYEPSQEITRIVNDLQEWVEKNPKTKVGMIHAPRVLINMNVARTLIEGWFQGGEITKTELIELKK